MTRQLVTLLWVMVLVPLSGGRTVQAQVAEDDSLALVALYSATDGVNWSDNTNWLTRYMQVLCTMNQAATLSG
jgi:uncharacterized protein YceK